MTAGGLASRQRPGAPPHRFAVIHHQENFRVGIHHHADPVGQLLFKADVDAARNVEAAEGCRIPGVDDHSTIVDHLFELLGCKIFVHGAGIQRVGPPQVGLGQDGRRQVGEETVHVRVVPGFDRTGGVLEEREDVPRPGRPGDPQAAGGIVAARVPHGEGGVATAALEDQAGMSINAIFEILSKDVLGNRYLEMLLKKSFDAVQRGESIARGFEKAGGFPPLLLGAVKNGETTGTLDEAFKRLGNYYDRQAQRTVQTMISAIEPLSIIMLGGIFGMIVLSILLPLYDVIGQF